MMQSDTPRKLYKFSGPTDYALQNLARGVIFCQHYSAYNDPFEFWTKILEGIPDAQLEPDRFAAAKNAWGADFMAADDEYLLEYFQSVAEEQPAFHEIRDLRRIACFGSSPDNLLMWSHYGDGLRGLCLVFDDTELLEASSTSAFAVNVAYQKSPPCADAFVYAVASGLFEHVLEELEEQKSRSYDRNQVADNKQTLGEAHSTMTETLQKIYATKPLEWEYEAERRLLVRAEQGGFEPVFHKYSRKALNGVLIGERMPHDFRRRLEKVVSDRYGHAYVKTVSRSSSSYNLEIG
jgi:hypothetical protein